MQCYRPTYAQVWKIKGDRFSNKIITHWNQNSKLAALLVHSVTPLTKIILITPKIIITLIPVIKPLLHIFFFLFLLFSSLQWWKLTQINETKKNNYTTILAVAEFINIAVNQFWVHTHLIINFIRNLSVVLVLSNSIWSQFLILCVLVRWRYNYNMDKTCIISQTSIMGIKCDGFLCFNLTVYMEVWARK